MKAFLDFVKRTLVAFLYVCGFFALIYYLPNLMLLIDKYQTFSLLAGCLVAFIVLRAAYRKLNGDFYMQELIRTIRQFNGWQRIQFVLSIVWALYIFLFVLGNNLDADTGLAALIVPILAIWLIPSLLIFVFKWIADGFKKQ